MNSRASRALLVPMFLAAVAAAAVAAAVADAPQPLRAAVVVVFVCLVPGYALVRLLRLRDPLLEGAVSVGASLAIAVLVSTLALYAGAWSPPGILVTLALVVVAAATADAMLATPRRDR